MIEQLVSFFGAQGHRHAGARTWPGRHAGPGQRHPRQ